MSERRRAWQSDIEDVLLAFAAAEVGEDSDSDVDERLVNFGLNYPFAHIWLPFVRYWRSQFAALPDEGGWWAQDAALMEDFETLTRLVNWHIRKAQGRRKAGGELTFAEFED